MPPKNRPGHFVVDGSNIATEGRSVPSLVQLNDAVLAFAADHPDALLTVVVDATFGHRIDKSEVAEFDEAVANNELVAPPAGAIGRGDAFVLTIADKANAGVLSNDSFQEFHGQYDWLFDEGRLVGGKPVPYVGWVFVDRTPVRGPKSRQAVKAAKSGRGRTTKKSDKVAASPEEAVAAKEMAKARIRPKSAAVVESTDSATGAVDDASTARDAKGRSRSSGRGRKAKAAASAPLLAADAGDAATEIVTRDGFVNELMPFLDFVATHAVGSSCDGTINTYASHGAYARVDDVNVYLPLRLMGDPPPRSARSVVNIGATVTMEIVGFVPDRRSIDAALVSTADESTPAGSAPPDDGVAIDADRDAASPDLTATSPSEATSKSRRSASSSARKSAAKKKAAAKSTKAKAELVVESDGVRDVLDSSAKAPAKKSAAKKQAAKRAASAKAERPAGAPKAAAKTSTSSAATKKASAKKAASKRPAAKKSAAKKAAAKKSAAKTARSTAARGRAASKEE